MEKIEISDKAVNAFAASAERLIGYLYAGILPLVILTLEKKDTVESFVGATGGVLAAIITITVGIGIYTIYFRVIGELFLFPGQHILHFLLDAVTFRKKNQRTSTVGLLVGYGVPVLRSRDAYESIKDMFFSNEERTRIQVDHGELHVLYITSVITVASYFFLNHIAHAQASEYYLWLSGITFSAAIIGDTRQHTKEAALVKKQEANIKKFLIEKGFIQ